MNPKIFHNNLSTKYLYLILGLLAMVFTLQACSDKDVFEMKTESVEPSEVETSPGSYLALSFAPNDADAFIDDPQFQSGAATESIIDPNGHHFAIFFDEDLNFHSLTLFNPGERTEYEDGNIEAEHLAFIKAGVSPLELDDPEDPEYVEILPKYCFVILNGSPLAPQIDAFGKQASGNSLTDLLKLKWAQTASQPIGYYIRDGKTYFTMSNAAYFEENPQGAFDLKIAGVITEQNRLFKTINQAKAAYAENPEVALKVKVERMVAKFTTRFTWTNEDELHLMKPTSNNPSAPFGSNQYITVAYFTDQGALSYASRVWDITILGWDITNLETENFVFKSLLPSDQISSYPLSVNSLADPINKFNDPQNWRCNWSLDCHYDEDVEYDNQYRHAIDKPSLRFFQNVESQHPLHYISGQEIRESVEENDPIYAPENTFSLNSNYNIAATFLIVKARLNIDLHYYSDNEGIPDDIFRSRKGIYYTSEEDYKRAFIIEINNKLLSNTSYNYNYYDWENWGDNPEGGSSRTLNLQQGENYRLFKELQNGRLLPVEDPEDLSLEDAFVIDGDSKKMVWAKDPNIKLVIARTYYNAEGDEIYEKVVNVTDNTTGLQTPITDNDIRSWFYDWIGAADHFAQGQMYYAKALPHNPNNIDPNQINVGDYGIVRNNWYNITVTSISKVGTPISNLSQPIIPTEVALEDGLVYDIDLLGWHIFETDVIFPSISF